MNCERLERARRRPRRGASESRPATGSASSPRTAPSRATDDPAADLLQPLGAERACRAVVDADDDEVVRVVGDGGGEGAASAGRSRGRARARRARSRGGARSRRSWRGRAPGRRRRARPRRSARPRARRVISCPGSISITRTRAGRRRSRSVDGERRGAHRRATNSGSRRRERLGAAVGGDQRAVLAARATARNDRQVVEQHEVGDVARGDRAAVEQPVGARAVQRGHHQRVLGGDALARPRSGTSGRCGPRGSRKSGSRSSVQNAQYVRPVLAHQRQQVAQVARVGGLADQHPHPAPALLQRLVEP